MIVSRRNGIKVLPNRLHCTCTISSIRSLTTEGIRKNLKKVQTKKIDASADAHDATRSLLSKIRHKNRDKNTYYDPSNTLLNLSLNNDVLFNKIYRDAQNRMDKRYNEESKIWSLNFNEIMKNIKITESPTRKRNMKEIVKAKLINYIKSAQITPEIANNPLGVGDLVALNEDSTDLYLITSCPSDLSSNSYIFINSEGRIIFGPKKLIKLRFPGVVPESFVALIREFVTLERKYLDIAPVGISDAQFSRSNNSLPDELKGTGSDDTESEGNMTTSEAVDDFVVAQASSQLLTNTNVNTYIVPLAARELYSEGLVHLSLDCFEKLPTIAQKLELLHRILQYDENGDLLGSPRTISIFQLLKYLRDLKINQSGDYDFSHIRKQIREDFLNDNYISNLGKNIPNSSINLLGGENDSYSISTFLALVLSLKQQARLWNINQQNSVYPPLSVNLIPIKNSRQIDKVLSYLKYDNGFYEFTNTFMEKIRDRNYKAPNYFVDILELFKGYIAGNLSDDSEVVTSLVTIIRMIDKKLISSKLYDEQMVSYSYEYSKARAYDILQMVKEECEPLVTFENPFRMSYSLQTPKISLMSRLSQEYYDYLDYSYNKGSKNDELFLSQSNDFYEEDPYSEKRIDFCDSRIYCIDSEYAHEIDDGISIKTKDKSYLISVHIANPTSYIKPDSELNHIAFSRGTTVYLPESPISMLPKAISNIAGLGENKLTRTFVIQFELDRNLIDDYISKKKKDVTHRPSKEISEKILNNIKATANVVLGSANYFPKNFTYKHVNETLNDPNNVEKYNLGVSQDIDTKNLFDLFHISAILKDIRLVKGYGLELNISRSNIQVEPTTDMSSSFNHIENGYQVTVKDKNNNTSIKIFNNNDQDADSKSQLLVSHFMIFANYAASIFAEENKIPVIFRSQEMKLDENIIESLRKITLDSYVKGKALSVDDISKILSVLTSARLHTLSKRHESLGLDSYATVTSPLRRYVDMINHWKIEEFLLAREFKFIKDEKVLFISTHLQNRELISKKIQQSSLKFWEGMFFKQYIELCQRNVITNPIKFKLLIKSDPKFGKVSVDVLGFNNLRAKLENNDTLIEKFRSREIKIDSVIETDSIKITKLDFIEDEIVFELI